MDTRFQALEIDESGGFGADPAMSGRRAAGRNPSCPGVANAQRIFILSRPGRHGVIAVPSNVCLS
jgi:hypothetical protein